MATGPLNKRKSLNHYSLQNMNEPLPTIEYTPESPLKHPGRFFRSMFTDLKKGRELAWRLALRDIRAQYRQAALGLLWAFILPIFNTATWIFLQLSGIVELRDTDLPYPVYVFCGTILWSVFTDAFNTPLRVSLAAKPMLAKINFPREAIIMGGLLETLFNSGIKIGILLIALALFGFLPSAQLLLFPIGLLAILIAGTSLGMLITPIGLLYSDVGKAIPILMQFLMYLTPVVFPLPKEGIAATLFYINPLTSLIMTTRGWLTGTGTEMLFPFLWITLGFTILLVIVWSIYKLAMPILIERMSA
jgi:lipopolysaccharide transport system permease protein